MPFVLRKLQKKRHWDLVDSSGNTLVWLNATAAPADALQDFHTSDHTLSVFLISSDKSDVGRVVAACALTRDSIEHFDFALLEYGEFQALQLRETATLGETPDAVVNDLHRNVEDLSAQDVASLAGAIRTKGNVRRYSSIKVRQAIEASVSGGCITIPKIREKMQTKLIEKGILP